MLFVVGIVNCLVWRCLLKSYKTLISAKFDVICAMEKHIGCSPYDDEWEILGRGKDKKIHRLFTDSELYVPCIFILAYVAIMLAWLMLK